MSRFYYELRQGRPVDKSLKIAVNQLRRGFEENLPNDSAFVAALDETVPAWRDELSKHSNEMKHPVEWGAFRCSGITWHPLESIQDS
jgi:hypothetical protein